MTVRYSSKPTRYRASAGERCKHDDSLRYVDININGNWSGSLGDVLIVPADAAQEMAAAINTVFEKHGVLNPV